MLTQGAIGNLTNRYRAVLRKCALINAFGSLAVAAMLTMGGAGTAHALDFNGQYSTPNTELSTLSDQTLNITYDGTGHAVSINYPSTSGNIVGPDKVGTLNVTSAGSGIEITVGASSLLQADTISITAQGGNGIDTHNATTFDVNTLTIHSKQNALQTQGIYAPATTANITVNAQNVSLTSDTGSAVCAGNGYAIAIQSDSLTINAPTALKAHQNGGGAVSVNVNKADITGDLWSKDGITSISLNMESGTLKGRINDESISTAENAGVSLALGSTAQWVVTDGLSYDQNGVEGAGVGDSSVHNLAFTDGASINMAGTEKNVTVLKSVSGNGTVVMDAAQTNTFTVAEGATQAGASITALASQNADNVSDAQAKALVERLGGVENKAALVEEGLTRGAMSVDASGTLSTARNTVMDAALRLASVTTVSLDRILTNDVRKRLGDIRSDQEQTGLWMRWDGGKLKGNGLTNNFNSIQIGGDTKVAQNCRLGIAGSFTHGDGDIARGHSRLEGFTFAAYSTWFAENGMFADIVGRIGHFSNDMHVEGNKGDLGTRFASLSGEYGWRFNVCEQFFVEPQVELAYSYVSSDNFQLGNAHYHFDHVDSLTGRAGVAFGWNLPDDFGNVYARASVLQQFMGDAKISGSVEGGLGNTQKIDGKDTWLEYGIGANIRLTDNAYVWADVERTSCADIEEEWRGMVGLRYSF